MNFKSVSNKSWQFKKYDNNKVQQISEKFSLEEITSRLLAIRNIEINSIEQFLNPTIKNFLSNPDHLLGMRKAVLRVIKSIRSNELIGVFGDYDVDGAASTALLVKYFNSLKQNIEIYIPDRQKDGYGPNIKNFETLINKGVKSIITVDCGTSSFDAIDYAQDRNVDVIVLDHHQSDTKLPNAHSIVNPNRYDDNSNLEYLCAAGVSFMFLVSLNKELRHIKWFNENKIDEPNILHFLDLVCLGTICDVVPLIGLNRAIVSQGLKVLRNRNNLGLKTLYDLCNISTKPNTYHVGYLIGPRINAGGRVGKSSYGAELLISNDSEKAYKIANNLNDYNKLRQNLEKELLIKVESQAEKNLDDPILILSDENWHEGVIGIIASRIKDKYNKPAFIISFKGEKGKGSARSVFGFDIGAAIISAVQSNILERGGGHKMAGGFSINKEKLDSFKNFIIEKFKKTKLSNTKSKNLFLDAVLSPSSLNESFFNQINMLSPFGSGNSEPIFVLENIKVVNSTIVADKHIKTIMYGKNGETISGIAFNSKGGVLEGYLTKSYKKKLHIAGKITLNEWHGKKNIEFVIIDVAI